MEAKQFRYMDPELETYYRDCIEFVNDKIVADKQKYRDLLSWIKGAGIKHQALGKALDYSYAGLLYRMFEYEPFRKFLDVNISFTGVKDLRIPRNLSLLSRIITKYEYLHHINVLTPKNIEEGTERFFNLFLRFLYKGGINEYEDETVYAPPGCVSFLTIHQSKGMEFPVVIVGSLSSTARDNADDIIGEVEETYFQREPFEPRGLIKLFDFWRLFYTAFSRAQNLLVLTSPETRADPNKYFKKRFYDLHSFFDNDVDLSRLTLEKVKDVNLKDSFAFTSDISVYETCAAQYKFFNVLDFSPVLVGATLYGRLVHETIEDIHRAALRGETHLINDSNIVSWFDTNYDSLSKAEHSYLAAPQLKAARDSILRYAELHRDKWENIVEAEFGVSLVKPDYIIAGKIDLLRSDSGDDAVEIVDFKSEKKPKINEANSVESERIERYKRQLQVYAYLVEQNTDKKVSKMHLYYTGEENGVPTITFEPSRLEIQSTIADFDKTVRKIQDKNFSHKSVSGRICENCDFRFYCKR
jgi:DNA helicase-2/ATP-dependent DNA helicase PcrA